MRGAAGVLSAVLALLQDRPIPDLPKLTESMSRAVTSSRNRIDDHVAYRHLMSPDAQLVIGRSCGLVGVPPRGRTDLLTLVHHERTDLLSRALRAPTPEARVYAALGLWSLRTIDHDEWQRFVNAITGPVRMCSECIFWSGSATETAAAHDRGARVWSLDW